MKKYNLFLLLAATVLTGCSKTGEDAGPDEMVPVEGLEISVGGMTTSGAAVARNVDDFAVNTANDPTHSMTQRQAWHFDLQIYKGNAMYTPYGTATMTWDTGSSRWVPTTALYFPNYTRQRVTADIYPDAKEAAVGASQTDAGSLLAQDILVQHDPNYRINPAHILSNIPVNHKHSMIDIILNGVNDAQIAAVSVEDASGNIVYQPYKIPLQGGFTKTEYLVILPVGVTDPVIHLTTKEGARYSQTLEITTAANVCFCVKMTGLELQLGGVTISDWTYGQALSGEYSVVTSYPTFKAPANTSVTLTFDNGLTQVLEFNSRGEATVKPAGRTITYINGSLLDPPIVLRSMMIDLNPHLP